MAPSDFGSSDVQSTGMPHRNALVNDDGQLRFTLLSGWTAYQLTLRGFWLQMAATACVFPIAFEFYNDWYYWAGGFAAMCFTLLGISLTWTIRGGAKLKQERANGYTTGPRDADDHPELYYLTGDDLQVISRPFAPRPPNGRRKVVRAFAGLPNEPLYRTRAGRLAEPTVPQPRGNAGRVDECGPGNASGDHGQES